MLELFISLGALLLLMCLIGALFVLMDDNRALNKEIHSWHTVTECDRHRLNDLQAKVFELELCYERVCLKRRGEYLPPETNRSVNQGLANARAGEFVDDPRDWGAAAALPDLAFEIRQGILTNPEKFLKDH